MIRLARLYLAIALLRTSRLLMLAGGRIVEADQRTIHATIHAKPATIHAKNLGSKKTQVRPVERILVGSIVGLALCTLWVWFSERAGR